MFLGKTIRISYSNNSQFYLINSTEEEKVELIDRELDLYDFELTPEEEIDSPKKEIDLKETNSSKTVVNKIKRRR